MDARNSNLLNQNAELKFLTDDAPTLFLSRARRAVSFMLPKNNRDSESDGLPDITAVMVSELQAMWKMDDFLEQEPIPLLIETVREHLDAIDPYINAVKKAQPAWYNCWQYIYRIAEDLERVASEESGIRFYTVPNDLRMQELRARMDLGKDEVDFNRAKEDHMNKLESHREKLYLLQQQIKEIKEATDTDALLKFDNPYFRDRAAENSNPDKPAGCLLILYSIFPCVRNKYNAQHAKPGVTPAVSVRDLESMRAELLTLYNDNLRFETGMYNDLGDSIPVMPDNYRSAWNEARAKIQYDRLEFYRCLSKDVMLHCVRLYALAFRTYVLIYGENPISDRESQLKVEQPRIKKIFDEDDKIVLKVKDLFKQLIQGLKVELNVYYCLQPSRRGFDVYLDNYVNIPRAEDRDAILAGNAADEVIDMVFDEFETPEEAFQLPGQRLV